MYVGITKDIALFRTPFSDEYDLVQKFRGVAELGTNFNNPVDFTESGLIRLDKWDVWHIDIPFAYSTDEAPCINVNNKHLGANHALHCAVSIYAPSHDKTVADIGSIWKDDEGTKWTLTSVKEDALAFVSENIGESKEKYAFKDHIASKLIYVGNGKNKSPIDADVESWKSAFAPIIRHTKRKIVAYIDGKPKVVNRAMECDYAEIHEEYDIVNPVSMLESLSKSRPRGGYKTPFYPAMGDTMITTKWIYRIEDDGTILCDFTIKKVMDIDISIVRGAMFQEKLDTYGGGVYRYTPKTKPLKTPEGTFDFSLPCDTAPGPYPNKFNIVPQFWENANNPPDRIVDYFRNREGKDCLGFACGYLPVLDGVAKIRKNCLESAVLVSSGRKAYPIFMSGDIETAHGIAYRKYFQMPKDRASVYIIPYGGKRYIYMDFFENKTLIVPTRGNIALYEKSNNVEYKIEDDVITATADKGYALFICD